MWMWNSVESSNDVLQKYLLDGTIDLAIANFSVRIPGIILRDFYEEEMVLIVSTALLQDIYGKQTESIIQEVSRHHRYSLLAPCPFLLNREHDLVGTHRAEYPRDRQLRPLGSCLL